MVAQVVNETTQTRISVRSKQNVKLENAALAGLGGHKNQIFRFLAFCQLFGEIISRYIYFSFLEKKEKM